MPRPLTNFEHLARYAISRQAREFWGKWTEREARPPVRHATRRRPRKSKSDQP